MHRSAPDSQADPPGALNLDSSSALETTQIVLLSMQRVHLYYRSPPPPSPLRYLVHGRRRCIHLFFFTMQTDAAAGAACICNSPSSPHERACCYIYGAMQREIILAAERAQRPPSFLISRASSFQTALFGVWFWSFWSSNGKFSHVPRLLIALPTPDHTPNNLKLTLSVKNYLA